MSLLMRGGLKLLLLLCAVISSSGINVYALDYDYSFTAECLARPLKPQYGGGVVANPEFDDGLAGWSRTGGGAGIKKRISDDGNNFIVAYSRKGANRSFSKKFVLEEQKLYIVSGWFQVNKGNAKVAAMVRTPTSSSQYVGGVHARSGCWSMLKGGFVGGASGPAELYFTSDNASVEIWADSISIQPFSQEEWNSHQNQSIEKTRKGKVRIHAVDPQGKPLANAKVSIKQLTKSVPLGCALSPQVLTNTAYAEWFASRFKVTVFENQMKWYETEPIQGREDYSRADRMLDFTKQHNILVRGHNIVWENQDWLPQWLGPLSPPQLRAAVDYRINSIVGRYKGQLIHWDGDNENVHFSFLTDRLGKNASAGFYQMAHEIDSQPLLFLNEIDTIERPNLLTASPANYLKKIEEMRAFGYNGPLGLGLEGHFDVPDLAYMRAGIDTLASANLPIWITELDVATSPTVDLNQVAIYLEQILREAHAHPAIQGIMIWSPWQPFGCYKMCLTDNFFKNLPAGDVVDKILSEWSHQGLTGYTDAQGYFETSLFHGVYEVRVSHSAVPDSLSHKFELNHHASDGATQEQIYVKVCA